MSVKGIGISLVAITALSLVVWWKLSDQNTTTGTTIGLPVIMRPVGGLLNVATLSINQKFTNEDTKTKFGLDLGKTVSEIEVNATYQYHIQLAPDWTVSIKDKTCTVLAPPITPTLPVAIDTNTIKKHTKNGWARFNKKQNLEKLEGSITAELEKRSTLPNYIALVVEPSRKTVSEFVLKWLIKDLDWKNDPQYKVVVSFKNEPNLVSK